MYEPRYGGPNHASRRWWRYVCRSCVGSEHSSAGGAIAAGLSDCGDAVGSRDLSVHGHRGLNAALGVGPDGDAQRTDGTRWGATEASRTPGFVVRHAGTIPCERCSISCARGQAVGVDGVFGPETETAIRAFQTGKGLSADGIVGPQTWPALIVTVRQGSRGDAVRGVQEEFQFRNLSGAPSRGLQVDGIFGQRTDEAVRGFQQALSLDVPSVAVDGIVGPITWRALVSGMLAG